LSLSVAAQAQVICVSNNVPPPELPVYDQPPLPAPGYIWTPGYWAGGPSGYFWVPGTWVERPAAGLLWTPGYWGWRDGIYIWTAGYWGTHVGFYGGIDYGFGYTGAGYEGGRWDHGVFAYNRAVNNFGGVRITNVYEKTIVENRTTVRVSFNGGSGGTNARPTPAEEAAAHEQHVAADPAQLQHERMASADRSLLASENHGHPAIAATAKPGDFSGKGVVAAREATPATPLGEKPAGAGSGAPNPAMTRLPEGKPLEEKPLEKGQLPEKSQLPEKASFLKKASSLKKASFLKTNLNGNAPPRPLNETKPLAPEGKPIERQAKPLTPERPVDTGRKLPENPQPSHEAKLPPPTAKPQLAPPPKPPAPQPHIAVAPPHPAPPPHPAAAPKPQPPAQDKKPPG
jgi:hypothetical protein